ncbi:nucleotidyltransferase family protein [Streptomyces sp. NPDC021020]|uniref:nucleotidyltransferase family protein n=1 Tax=Streptomyces sp. NPDC021020 TaxID=3365109 RepID=UPI00379E916B
MQRSIEQVSAMVADLVRRLVPEQFDLPPRNGDSWDASSLKDLGIDSLVLVQLVNETEQAFGIRIADDDLSAETFATFGSVVALVARYGSGEPQPAAAAAAQPEPSPAAVPPAEERPDPWAAAGPEGALLLCTAKVGMTADDVTRAVGLLGAQEPPLDWGVFVDLATRHRVLGLVAHNIDREHLGPIGPVRRSVLRAAYLYNLGRAHSWERERRQLLASFNADGLTPVARKGMYLAPYVYPDVAMRYMEDTDIYVTGGDVEGLGRTMRRLGYAQGSYSRDRRTVQDVPRDTELFWALNVAALTPFQRATSDPYIDFFSVDVRRDLMEPASGKSIPAEDFLARARRVPLAGDTALVPSDEDVLLDVGVHLFREATTLSSIRAGKDLCLIRFVDIVQWYRHTRDTLDPDALVALAERYDVTAELYYSLHFTDELYPGVLAPELLDRLRPDDLGYLEEYGRLDGKPATWPVGFRHRVFDRNRLRHVSEQSALPRPQGQW